MRLLLLEHIVREIRVARKYDSRVICINRFHPAVDFDDLVDLEQLLLSTIAIY